VALTLAHLSDTHLGFRAFSRTDEFGVNMRERDVMQTFTASLNAIADRDPDLVVHSGDFFHVVRPSNSAIVATFRRLTDFQTKRRGKPLVIIAGNHDTPRSSDSGNLLNLFTAIDGVKVATQRAEALEIAELDAEVLCIPHPSLAAHENVLWRPSLGRKHSVLVLHGMESSVAAKLRIDSSEFEFRETGADGWTYVALGDVHVHQKLAPNSCYPGSTDFASSDPWGEIGIPKGWVWFDSAVGDLEFVPVQTRLIIDLPRIDGAGLSPVELAEKLVANAKWDAEAFPVVRQRIQSVTREVWSRMGVEWRREIAARALNYQPTPSAPAETWAADIGHSSSLTLEAEWARHVAAASLPGGVTRDEVATKGLEYLQEVEAGEAVEAEA
jgi:DNA repair exonuclease SbcCD nuclease subunit